MAAAAVDVSPVATSGGVRGESTPASSAAYWRAVLLQLVAYTNADGAALAQRAGHVVTGRPRAEGDVEQDHVEVALGRLRYRRVAVGHGRHAVALALERAREHLTQRLVVVDDEDLER